MYQSSLSGSPYLSHSMGVYSPQSSSNGSIHSQEGYNSAPNGHFHQTMDYTLKSKYNGQQTGRDLLQMVTSASQIQGHLTNGASINADCQPFIKGQNGHLGQTQVNQQNTLCADDVFQIY